MKMRTISWVLGIGIIVLVLFSWLTINLISESNRNELYFSNLSINASLFSEPKKIVFNADKLEFSGNNLNLTFDSYFLFNLQNISILQFNIGNETYKFIKDNSEELER